MGCCSFVDSFASAIRTPIECFLHRLWRHAAKQLRQFVSRSCRRKDDTVALGLDFGSGPFRETDADGNVAWNSHAQAIAPLCDLDLPCASAGSAWIVSDIHTGPGTAQRRGLTAPCGDRAVGVAGAASAESRLPATTKVSFAGLNSRFDTRATSSSVTAPMSALRFFT